MTVEEGRDRRSGERRPLAAPPSLLLPASQVLQDSVNLLFFAESLKERQQVQQLRVIHIVEPGLDWHLRRRGGGGHVGHFMVLERDRSHCGSETLEELTAFSGWKM